VVNINTLMRKTKMNKTAKLVVLAVAAQLHCANGMGTWKTPEPDDLVGSGTYSTTILKESKEELTEPTTASIDKIKQRKSIASRILHNKAAQRTHIWFSEYLPLYNNDPVKASIYFLRTVLPSYAEELPNTRSYLSERRRNNIIADIMDAILAILVNRTYRLWGELSDKLKTIGANDTAILERCMQSAAALLEIHNTIRGMPIASVQPKLEVPRWILRTIPKDIPDPSADHTDVGHQRLAEALGLSTAPYEPGQLPFNESVLKTDSRKAFHTVSTMQQLRKAIRFNLTDTPHILEYILLGPAYKESNI
jgi:hypothetical protein